MIETRPKDSHRRRALRAASAAVRIAAASGMLLLMACDPDSGDPDKDDRRGRAKPVSIGQIVTDTIDPPIDAVDWKIIEVPGGGFLTVNVFWDNADVNSVVTLVDKFGVTVEEEVRDKNTPADEIIVKSDNESSFYFVKIESEEGRSVYSVQTSFTGGGAGPIGNEPIPEFDRPIEPGSEGEEVKPGGGGGGGGGQGGPSLPPLSGGGGGGGGGFAGGGGGGGGASVANTGGGPGGGGGGPARSTKDIVPDISGPFDPVSGQILRVIPNSSGGAEITIGVGTNNGIQRNHVGEIMMKDGQRLEGGRFVITNVFKRSATGRTNAPANVVGASSQVVVKVPR